ncbi:MAG: hypothetical protein AUJ70_01630 [Candidatus Omnitrophica bacterium CG1_02_40_15]|nr:MAG: hypothetical protein AUJ70_01630 [Candidatus Omnitrophica bacterium CG1_02_40_15]
MDKKDLARRKTPEEHELEEKQVEFTCLEQELVKKELELVTLQAELHAFQNRYLRIVGIKYSELDEINAQIAECLAELRPKDAKAREQAKRAREQAEDSAHTAEEIKKTKPAKDFESNERLKSLYRKLAMLIHPDTTTDPKEKERRHRLMVEINRAYEEGDEESLQKILDEWESSPDSVQGEGTAAELVRTIRKISQVKKRLSEIEKEIVKLRQSELCQLKVKVEEVKDSGRDLLAEMAAQIEKQISEARKQLNVLRKSEK